jgi:hypothetical protein
MTLVKTLILATVILMLLEYSNAAKSCGTFNPNMYICCDGNLNNKAYNSDKCCGQKRYYPNNSICCNGTIRNKGFGTTSCCGTHPYNPSTANCVDGKIQSKRYRGRDFRD